MTLSKRALLLIFPVVLSSFCLAAFIAYLSLQKTTHTLEQKSLDLAVTELAASFNQYATFADSYLMALIESSAFRKYVSTDSNRLYDNIALSASIESTIRGFKQHQTNKLSFLVVETPAQPKTIYFFELSDDPFSEPNPAALKAINEAWQYNQAKYWSYVDKPEASYTAIMMSKTLDRRTFTTPMASDKEQIIIVQFSLEPTSFIQLKKAFESHFGVSVSISASVEPSADSFFSAAPITGGLYLSASVPSSHMNNDLQVIGWALAGICLLFFAVSSLLLYYLLKRYITLPIEKLENALSNVSSMQQANITVHSSPNNEIGRLERAFHKLYGDLSDAYKKTKELAEKDRLTKLHNISFIGEQAHRLLAYAHEHDEHLAFIYIDLDNFKFVNDKYGHSLGDELLRAFAVRVSNIIQNKKLTQSDKANEIVYGRIAGDEFAIVVPHIFGDQIATNIANRILHLFQDGFHFEKGTFPITATIGISMYPDDGHTLSQLMSNADSAMYHAKRSGKNQVAFYSREMAEKERRLREIENELKSTTPEEEFFLVYMPLVGTQSGKIEGFETLLRWHSKKLGFVGPDEFIPIAEACGLFEKIDNWVIEAAIKHYHPLKERLGYDYKLSVNLSSAQLELNTISQNLVNLINEYQVAPQNIQLEMTETIGVEYTKNANRLLQTLVNYGFKIAIDDFGTGYTALLQLLEYPAQMIKFDKTFVEKSLLPENRQMLPPLISLCHSQNLQITAEGVETQEVADYLASIGCDYLQGYLYGKPAKLEDLVLSLPER